MLILLLPLDYVHAEVVTPHELSRSPLEERITMARHAVHTLRANLEAARLKAINELAATDGEFRPDALQALATLEMALTAVREAIEIHGPRLGWGGNDELD